MSGRKIDGFFYGLFMDSDILERQHIHALNPRQAYVEGFRLRIGNRATLVPESGARAYGMLFALAHDDLDKLYAGPGLEAYRPEAVVARTLVQSKAQTTAGDAVPALVYNLLTAPEPHEANAEYAARLRDTLGRLGFPAEYIASVA